MPLALARYSRGSPPTQQPARDPTAALSPLALGAPPPAPPTPEPPPIQETYLDALLKLVPSEVLTFYTAAVPIVREHAWPAFSLFVFGLVLTPVVLFLDGRSSGQRARWPQYVIRTLAFVAWSNAVSNPFQVFGAALEGLSWLRSLSVLLVPLLGTLLIQSTQPEAPVEK
ncbi:MAG TPA: hypothetical protein VFP84_15505 [Kofleriaceae bacterium]|nr:hypothetical protein [Kofleriaceae bacterium]